MVFESQKIPNFCSWNDFIVFICWWNWACNTFQTGFQWFWFTNERIKNSFSPTRLFCMFTPTQCILPRTIKSHFDTVFASLFTRISIFIIWLTGRIVEIRSTIAINVKSLEWISSICGPSLILMVNFIFNISYHIFYIWFKNYTFKLANL